MISPSFQIRLGIFWHRFWPGIVAAIVYLLLCFLKSGPTRLVHGTVWRGWWDQGQYLQSTLAFANGNLSASEHWYPLLYSLFAFLFLLIDPGNPFLPLHIICVGILAQSLTRVARYLDIGRGAALIVLLLSVAFPPRIWTSWVEPWTTTLSAALIWWLMARAGDVAVAKERLSVQGAVSLGMGAALIPLARPADGIIVAIFGICFAVSLLRQGQLTLRLVAAAIAGAALPITLYALLHLAIYGPRITDYMAMSGEFGLAFANIGWKSIILFLDPSPWFPGDIGLLRGMPWLPLGLAGLIFVLFGRDSWAQRSYLGWLALAAIIYTVLLTAYVDLLPSGLWRYCNLHYFKWIFPLLALLAWRLLRDGRHQPRLAIVAMLAVFALTGFRMPAVPAGAGEPARRIDFALRAPSGDRQQIWERLYFARSVITDNGAIRRNLFDYHQLPDGRIVRAIALRADFGPAPRWYEAGMPGTAWPVHANQDRSRHPLTVEKPIARWKRELRWGVPCWLRDCSLIRDD